MLAVKNFDKFQHYKDRSPVWIKLYRSLLRDYEFAKLPDAARGQLVLIWLLASEMGNRLPNDAQWIGCQINASEPVNLAILLETGFLVDCDSNSDSNHDASDMMLAQRREREEKETETEKETEASRGKRATARRSNQCDEEFLEELQRNPAYAALDVRALFHKMTAWCSNKGKLPTRGRLINWLNREDKPMTAKSSPAKSGNGHVGASPKPTLVVQPADNNAYMSKCVEDLIADEDLLLGGQIYDEIVQRGGAKLDWEIRLVAWYELHKDEPATPEQVAQINASIQLLAKR